jgi:hypothetical protein
MRRGSCGVEVRRRGGEGLRRGSKVALEVGFTGRAVEGGGWWVEWGMTWLG